MKTTSLPSSARSCVPPFHNVRASVQRYPLERRSSTSPRGGKSMNSTRITASLRLASVSQGELAINRPRSDPPPCSPPESPHERNWQGAAASTDSEDTPARVVTHGVL